MADHEKIVHLHSATSDISPEERARRLGVEVERLTRLPPFEWALYSEEPTKRYGLEQSTRSQG